MTEVKKQKGSSLQGILQEQEEQDDRVSEWEEGLPSLADLISLSQCLISPQLASAFSITSPSPSPAHSPADVALASRSTFSSLCGASLTCADPFGSSNAPEVNPSSQSHAGAYGGEDPQLNAGGSTRHGAEASQVSPRSQQHAGEHSLHVGHASEMIHKRHFQSDERSTPPDAQAKSYGGEMSARGWNDSSQPALAGNLRRYDGDTSVRKEGSSPPVDGYNEVIFIPSEGDEDGVGEGDGPVHASAAPCISDSSDVAAQADDGEAEEAESVPSPSENPNEETIARTLKRPRLVWTPELHKRFVDAVSHLGVKTAVPKTIMQLMNVEGLTRENVASHLQKYRLYLKRMQGLSNEGPTSSDHLFASTPVPANLAAAGRFHAGMPAHLQDISQVPFAPTHNPISMGRGHLAGIMSSPLPSMDPYSFNVFARPPSHRLVRGDLQDVQVFRHHHSTPMQHIPKK